MNIFFIGVVVSILVYIVVGIWAGRSVKDVNDYYVSGRNAPTILIAGTLFASMLSVNGFMGDQG
jgi:sodium/pantothenate symporter